MDRQLAAAAAERERVAARLAAEEAHMAGVLAARMEAVRRERVDIEAACEVEQEQLVNRMQRLLARAVADKQDMGKRATRARERLVGEVQGAFEALIMRGPMGPGHAATATVSAHVGGGGRCDGAADEGDAGAMLGAAAGSVLDRPAAGCVASALPADGAAATPDAASSLRDTTATSSATGAEGTAEARAAPLAPHAATAASACSSDIVTLRDALLDAVHRAFASILAPTTPTSTPTDHGTRDATVVTGAATQRPRIGRHRRGTGSSAAHGARRSTGQRALAPGVDGALALAGGVSDGSGWCSGNDHEDDHDDGAEDSDASSSLHGPPSVALSRSSSLSRASSAPMWQAGMGMGMGMGLGTPAGTPYHGATVASGTQPARPVPPPHLPIHHASAGGTGSGTGAGSPPLRSSSASSSSAASAMPVSFRSSPASASASDFVSLTHGSLVDRSRYRPSSAGTERAPSSLSLSSEASLASASVSSSPALTAALAASTGRLSTYPCQCMTDGASASRTASAASASPAASGLGARRPSCGSPVSASAPVSGCVSSGARSSVSGSTCRCASPASAIGARSVDAIGSSGCSASSSPGRGYACTSVTTSGPGPRVGRIGGNRPTSATVTAASHATLVPVDTVNSLSSASSTNACAGAT